MPKTTAIRKQILNENVICKYQFTHIYDRYYVITYLYICKKTRVLIIAGLTFWGYPTRGIYRTNHS